MKLDEIIGKYQGHKKVTRKNDTSLYTLIGCGIPISVIKRYAEGMKEDPSTYSDYMREQLEADDWMIME